MKRIYIRLSVIYESILSKIIIYYAKRKEGMIMHIYTDENNNEYPSVTTIIHKVLLDPEPLLIWSNIMGFKHKKYEDIMETTSTFGTALHSVMEHYMKNENGIINVDPILALRINHILDLFEDHCKSIDLHKDDTDMTEKTIISEKLGYAGTIDWVGKYRGKLTILDYKTSKKCRLPMLIQLSAYDKLLQTEMGLFAEQAVILNMREDKIIETIIDRNKLDELFEIFLILKDLYYRLEKL